MKVNHSLKAAIMEVMDNQIKNNDPPETSLTLKRLQKEGFSEFDARQLIGQCVAVELFDVIKLQKPYDNERYIGHLLNLPTPPVDD